MIIIRRPADIPPAEITEQALYLKRREFIKAAAVAATGLIIPGVFATPRRADTLGRAVETGFKGAKSIVRIRFVEKQPVSAWTKATPNEYGFYSNVNPNVDHPR